MAKRALHARELYQDETTGNLYQLNPDGTYTQISTAGADYVTLALALAGEDFTNDLLKIERRASYETVAASQTDQVMGATGAAGDMLDRLLVIPATTAPGAISIKDGAGSAITVYTGGTVGADLTPFVLPIGAISTAGAWKVTTGVNVSVIAIGRFT